MKEKHAKFHDLQVLPKKALECTEYTPQTPRTFLIAQKWVWKTGVGGKKVVNSTAILIFVIVRLHSLLVSC